MSESETKCPYCEKHSHLEVMESVARFIAAIEASHREDEEAFIAICESANALDYHGAVNVFIDLLNEIGQHGFDPVATMETMRASCNEQLAQAQ